MTETQRIRLPGPRADVPIAVLLGVLLLGALAPALGVWEPWEAERAGFVADLSANGQVFVAEMPRGAEDAPRRFELPYGFWPTWATVSLFGERELGLRLPGLLGALGVLALLMAVVRRFYGRLAGHLAVLAALCMPLFVHHGRHLLGLGVSSALMAMAALALLRVALDDEAGPAWRWGAWLALAGSALTGGVVGLAAPLVGAGVAAWMQARGEPEGRPAWGRLLGAPAAVAAVLVAVGWWKAAAALPDDGRLASLLLWTDPFTAPVRTASPPTFETYVHQIGFGLFPIGALVPLAFGTMLWGDPPADEPSAARHADIGLAAWFAVAFIGPALAVPETHTALFPGSAAVAAAAGVYLARAIRLPPQPVLVVAAVVILALLDSNLKHETHYLADVVVGTRVDSFPPKLPGWPVARVLSFCLLAVLILFQGGAHRALAPVVGFFAYPKRHLGPLSGWPLIPGGLAALLVGVSRPDWFIWLVSQGFWGRTNIVARRALVLLAIGLLVHVLARALWNWRVSAAARTPRRSLVEAAGAVSDALSRHAVAAVALPVVLAAWALFMNVPVALALTTNFSQKSMLQSYERLADDEEPLFKYKVDPKTTSFYARTLPDLNPNQFKDKAKAEERFFAIIPRPQLAAINGEFRQATGRTLPVLDAESFRFLLVSNLLEPGEQDHNPITRALVPELPASVTNRVQINFDDKVELVGWALDPPSPKPGSPVKITLYWKVLAKVPGNYKVFVHLDTAGARIHGDHDPVEGLYPTTNWSPGDIIRDEHRVVVKATNPSGRYTFYAGLFRGDQRMPVKSGDKDNENRARLGYVQVK